MADRLFVMLMSLLGLLAAVVLASPVIAQTAEAPDARLAEILAEARKAEATPGACARPDPEALVQIYCRGEIRIGVRERYPLFGFMAQEERVGYDVDTGRAVAHKLGVTPRFQTVNAADRISKLAEGRIDLIIATMGHNTQRDGQVRFIRPHYYRSETILVGPRDLKITDWHDIAGRSVCVTIGNGSNAQLVSRGARLMLFDAVGILPARLQDGTCTLAAQDDSFFAYYLAEPGFASRYDVKFGFARVPWGMAIAPGKTDRLGEALDLISQVFHRDGAFLALARQNHIRTPFLEEQQAVWQGPRCNRATGHDDPDCVQPALDASLEPTGIVAQVVAFEQWVHAQTGVPLNLAMLKTQPAWILFRSGLINSLLLVAGAVAATL
ncbi:MAG: transporter substrate-binding domain-containing protein, partial [Proteobacteria bacterium]|nr:transporter substrate-binding domain-containing protein [Pseudomonadota bacterium]